MNLNFFSPKIWNLILPTIRHKRVTDIDILFMVENGIRVAIYHAIYRYAKPDNTYMKNCDKNKELSYFEY